VFNKTCSRRTLATNDFTIVEHCSCGSIHLTIGALTLRIAASTIPALAATLGEAARALVLHDAFALARTNDEAVS
jgi:hypothetical protein